MKSREFRAGILTTIDYETDADGVYIHHVWVGVELHRVDILPQMPQDELDQLTHEFASELNNEIILNGGYLECTREEREGTA